MPYGKGTYGKNVGRPFKELKKKIKKENEKEEEVICPSQNRSPKQKKLARIASPRDKITGADFKKNLKEKRRKIMATKNVPTNKALYARVKAEAKRKV